MSIAFSQNKNQQKFIKIIMEEFESYSKFEFGKEPREIVYFEEKLYILDQIIDKITYDNAKRLMKALEKLIDLNVSQEKIKSRYKKDVQAERIIRTYSMIESSFACFCGNPTKL